MNAIIFVTLAFTAAAYGANHHGLTVEEIAQLVVAKVDVDGDGILTPEEIKHEFVTNYDHDGDGCAAKHEFTHQWNKDYHDDHQAADQFFIHLDISSNGCLDEVDLQLHHGAMDEDGDGSVTKVEFIHFMHMVHPDREHGHGHHGR